MPLTLPPWACMPYNIADKRPVVLLPMMQNKVLILCAALDM